MVAAGLWIVPGSPFAWLLLLYPPLVLIIIVGTGHHWVLDGAVGALTVVFGFVAAWWLHRTRAPPPEPLVRAIALALAYALAIDFADALSSGRVSLMDPSLASVGVPALIVVAALAARRR